METSDAVDNNPDGTSDVGQCNILSSTSTNHKDLDDQLIMSRRPPLNLVPADSSEASTSVPIASSYTSIGSLSSYDCVGCSPGSIIAVLLLVSNPPVGDTTSVYSGRVIAPLSLPTQSFSQETNMYTLRPCDTLSTYQYCSHDSPCFNNPELLQQTDVHSTHFQQNQPPPIQEQQNENEYPPDLQSSQPLGPETSDYPVWPEQPHWPEQNQFRIQQNNPIVYQLEKTDTVDPQSLLPLQTIHNLRLMSAAYSQLHPSLTQESLHFSVPTIQSSIPQQDQFPVQPDHAMLYHGEESLRSDPLSLSFLPSIISCPSLTSSVAERSRSTMQPSPNDPETSTESFTKVYACHKCDSYFRTQDRLRSHESNVRKNPIACDKCGKKFCQIHRLNYHIRTVHRVKIRADLKCKFCGRNFLQKNTLKEHILNAHKSHIPDEDVDELLSKLFP